MAAIREAVNRLLPVANIGGELLGVRLLALCGIETTQAAASVIVEVFLTLVSLCFFVAFGVLCLLHVTDESRFVQDVTLWLALTVPLLMVLAVLLRNQSAFALLGRATQRLMGGFARRFRHRRLVVVAQSRAAQLVPGTTALCAAVLFQVASLLIGALETWLVLSWVQSSGEHSRSPSPSSDDTGGASLHLLRAGQARRPGSSIDGRGRPRSAFLRKLRRAAVACRAHMR